MKRFLLSLTILGMVLFLNGNVQSSNPVSTYNCNPGRYQVALFEDINYKGKCVVLPAITVYGKIPFRNDAVSSIKVGRNVYAVLFENYDWKGVSENFMYRDPNLTNNKVGNDRASSIMVLFRPCD